MVFKPSRPSIGSCARKRARTPARSITFGTRPPGRCGNAIGHYTGPAVKTSNPRLSPCGAVAPSVASGLGGRILAAGPARVRLYSYSSVYVNDARISSLGLGSSAGRRHRLIPSHRASVAPSDRFGRVSSMTFPPGSTTCGARPVTGRSAKRAPRRRPLGAVRAPRQRPRCRTRARPAAAAPDSGRVATDQRRHHLPGGARRGRGAAAPLLPERARRSGGWICPTDRSKRMRLRSSAR